MVFETRSVGDKRAGVGDTPTGTQIIHGIRAWVSIETHEDLGMQHFWESP